MAKIDETNLGHLINNMYDSFLDKENIIQGQTVTLATVATTGSYDDLIDKPTIPEGATISTDIEADATVDNKAASPKAVKTYTDGKFGPKTDVTNVSLADVAVTGDYDDLINKPSIPAAQVSSDWNAASGVAQILNKPTLDNTPTANSDNLVKSGGVKAALDLKQDTINANNKLPYSYISDTPTIPAAQVNSDWDAVSGVAQILNKPTIPTVPTTSTNLYTDKADNSKVAGSKASYDEIHPATASSQPVGGMLPNILYELGTLSTDTTFSLASPIDNAIINHYFGTFETGSTAPTITGPSGITGAKGTAPTINANAHYEISVLNNIAGFLEA